MRGQSYRVEVTRPARPPSTPDPHREGMPVALLPAQAMRVDSARTETSQRRKAGLRVAAARPVATLPIPLADGRSRRRAAIEARQRRALHQRVLALMVRSGVPFLLGGGYALRHYVG